MNSGVWSDGAPTARPAAAADAVAGDPLLNNVLPPTAPGTRPEPLGPTRFTDRITQQVNTKWTRISSFEGKRGRSTRAALAMKWTSYYLIVLLACGLTEALTANTQYANHGGIFMLVCVAIVAVVGAGSTLFYVNLRTEIVEKVRHYVFGIMVIPGLIVALVVRLLQEWEWVNTGSIGSTLAMAMPIIFLSVAVLPMFVFIKEMLAIRTIYRSKLDDQEAVQLWTRQDGLQR